MSEDCKTCEPCEKEEPQLIQTLTGLELELRLKNLFSVFKEKYNLDLDAEINIPKVVSGHSTFFYVLFVRGQGDDKDKVLPILRVAEKLDKDNWESKMNYIAYENTLKVLLSDAIIKEISDKARSHQEGNEVPKGDHSTDIPVEPVGSDGGKDADKKRKGRKNK